ncbi:MAG: NADH-quinone oxidoreductase subunit C [Candidatus Marsarchaeota archaeon]|nr:NADH-quinone oxidoreductase subunit C [Candidatus Marsarchaeota archaeon]MCL5111733.1 NADH-quinone oxidoreductase subunit C [Candidatus Marsarchaeota archaeon]
MLDIQPGDLAKTCAELKSKGFDYLKKITAVDYIDHLEVVYMLYNTKEKKDEIIKVKMGPSAPEVHTIMKIYPAADWYERELSEMFGIRIQGRDARRLLLELWNGTGAPLRKSFIWGKDYDKVE